MKRYPAAVLLGALTELACAGSKSTSPFNATGSNASAGGRSTASAAGSGGGSPSDTASSAGTSSGLSSGVGPVDAEPVADATTADTGASGQTAVLDGGPGVEDDGAEELAGDGASGAPWPAVSDYAEAGPFPPTRQMNTGPGGAYDVFQPAVLTDNRKHPIVSWANGTLYTVDDYALLLQHWASYGFVVIAGHTSTTAGGATIKAGIDWLVAEDAIAASPYFAVLDVTKIGAAGHSQGGGATIAAGANEPGTTGITTTLPLMPLLKFEADPTIVSRQLVPMFNVNATMDVNDPTGMVANAIYDGAVTELVQAAFIGVHQDAMNVKMQAPTVAWFRWKLMGDVVARAFFYPVSTCSLCEDPDWQSVRYKNPSQ